MPSEEGRERQEGRGEGGTRGNGHERHEKQAHRHPTSPASPLSPSCPVEATLSDHCLDFLEAQKQADLADLLDKLGIVKSSETSASNVPFSAAFRHCEVKDSQVFTPPASREVGSFYQNKSESSRDRTDTAENERSARAECITTSSPALPTSDEEGNSEETVSNLAGEKDESHFFSELPVSGSPLAEQDTTVFRNDETVQEEDKHSYRGRRLWENRTLVDAAETKADVVLESSGLYPRIKAAVSGMRVVKAYRNVLSWALGKGEQWSVLPREIDSRNGRRCTPSRSGREKVKSISFPSQPGVQCPLVDFQHRGRSRKSRRNLLPESVFFPSGMSFAKLRLECCGNA
ncbi:conserved hypothetical protein [Neospora caninum Liverpool]|uniref:Uncharacterized protein n=1 Tax=Neospora caninum (strain Liverpool) TaxID=572307 RepID=F0VI48_NEOCL|nr:conserved hypothetical protein [Neospora caninum Liverpool]CBZ53409.1 conserved hypothetical protein [Neospora caninum Liverpool]CEL67396.1 TPA: hypothetical protein BN1204_031960 [Neospora caninum Liverpool]|eukprot:XP_003883441.1 conserved hypothetical protein [Neospora caninum Liverpool]